MAIQDFEDIFEDVHRIIEKYEGKILTNRLLWSLKSELIRYARDYFNKKVNETFSKDQLVQIKTDEEGFAIAFNVPQYWLEEK